jgi:hypothetical protein
VEKALKIVKELKAAKVIQDYAIGGGIAVLYYVEPLLTYDMDILFVPAEDSIDVLSPLYKYLKDRGYKTRREHIIIEGVPMQFIPAYNELVTEAIQKSIEARYGRIKTKIIGLEYLAAIMLQTYRAKDRERLIKIHEEAKIKMALLKRILEKFSLFDKYTEFRRKFLG